MNTVEYKKIIPWFFVLCGFLYNPSLFLFWRNPLEIQLITSGALGLITTGLLFLDMSKLINSFRFLKTWSRACIVFLLTVVLVHYFLNRKLAIQHLGESLCWVTIPVFTLVHHDFFKKNLKGIMTIFFVFNMIFCIAALLLKHPMWENGITRNINWTASLTVISLPFVIALIREKFPDEKEKSTRIFFIFTTLLFTVCLVIKVGSVAVFLAAGIMSLLILWLHLNKAQRKIIFLCVAGIILAMIAILYSSKYPLEEKIMEDGRITLYEGAINIIRQSPLFGVGQGNFENEFMVNRPPEYFLTPHVASRSNHPHNHFLFFAACNGLLALFCWLTLLLFPLIQCLRKLLRNEDVPQIIKLCFLCTGYLLLHGMLDLVIYMWPTNLFFLITTGLLWQEYLQDSHLEKIYFEEKIGWRKMVYVIPGFLMICCGLFAGGRSCYASSNVLKLKDKYLTAQEKLQLIRDTVTRCSHEYQANFDMLAYLERNRNPEMSLYVSEIMLRGNIPNYPGVSMGRGNALLFSGRLDEALQCYLKEAELFPFALRPINNALVIARQQKNQQLVISLTEEMNTRMKVRKITPQMLHEILRGRAHYDLRPWDIPVESGGPGSYKAMHYFGNTQK